ncbi:MAG: hypothetical protein WB952_08130 [Terriglobales bacterium]
MAAQTLSGVERSGAVTATTEHDADKAAESWGFKSEAKRKTLTYNIRPKPDSS